MSERNKQILIDANAAVSKGEHDGFLAYCTDDVVWTFVGDQTLTGKAAVRKYMQETYVQPPRFHVEALIAEGETVVATGEIELTDAGGKTTRYAYCDVWHIREGKLSALTAYVVELKQT